MPKEEKLIEKAKSELDKAELLFDQKRFDKSSKQFQKTAEIYMELANYQVAEQCYYYAAQSYLHEGNYYEGSSCMRDAANCCIFLDDYNKAADLYDVSAKYALKSSKRDAEFKSILSACFAYLCWFLKGQQDKGLAFIKRIKKDVDSKEFSENRLSGLVKGLTLAIINRDDSSLKQIEEEFIEYKFRESETILIKDAIVLAKTHLLLGFDIEFESKEVINEQSLSFSLTIDFSRLKELENDPYLKRKIASLRIIDVGVTQSDNLSSKSKPNLPIDINDQKIKLDFKSRANFPGDGFVGPIVFTLEIDKKLYFFAKTKSYEIKVKSPPARLGIEMKPLTNPIINQTFPMEIKIFNPSDADVVNINTQMEFPPTLRIMRGTLEKQIYQILRGDDFRFQISLKPLEPGTHVVKITISYSDQDGAKIGPITEEIPFEITL